MHLHAMPSNACHAYMKFQLQGLFLSSPCLLGRYHISGAYLQTLVPLSQAPFEPSLQRKVTDEPI